MFLSFYFDFCVFDNVEQKVCYFRVVSARKTTARLLNVPRETVSVAICRFKELGNDGRRPGSGRKCTVNTSRNCNTIEKRVQRNPRVTWEKATDRLHQAVLCAPHKINFTVAIQFIAIVVSDADYCAVGLRFE
ncbi:hypothetical protein TNCV_792601 [Trichonephila clavipes]|nr:hypothetical protein TNCV_792601 [Trichonephila clavipes]